MKNIYSVSTGCYSDYDETILLHNKKFTKEEFKDICSKALEKVRKTDDYISTEDETVKVLTEEYGFEVATYLNCHLFDYSSDDELPKVYEKGGIED